MSVEVAAPQRDPVNVNTASVALLRDGVVGIGQVLAERVVAFREERGPFGTLADLTQVSGIGPALLARIADQLTTGERGAMAEDSGVVAATAADAEEETRAQPEAEMAELAEPETGEPAQEAGEEELQPVLAEAIAQPEEEALAEGEGMAQPTPEGEEPPEEPPTEPEQEVPLPEMEPIEEAIEAAEAQGEPEAEFAGEPEPQPEEALRELEVDETTFEEEEPAEVERAQVPVPPEAVVVRPTFWHNFLLVLLGGLVGVALTLAVAIIWSGTVDFAPRQEVDALSRNLHTMQTNQGVAWDRIDQVTLRTDELERKVSRLEALTERVDALEKGLGEAQRDLRDTKAALEKSSEDLAALRGEVEESVGQLNERMGKAEAHISRLVDSLTRLQKDFEAVETRVQKFDAFFAALRDLLIDMEGSPTPALSKSGKGPMVVPTPTAKISSE